MSMCDPPQASEMDLPTIDSDKTFGIRFEHDDKLDETQGREVCIQCALLYTTHAGERRIRVHTLSLPITGVLSNIFRYSDLDAIINLSLKQAVRQIFVTSTPAQTKKDLAQACIDSLFVYRKFCAKSATSSGQLILPEPLKLLPLTTLGLIKHGLFQSGLLADERCWSSAFVTSMPISVSIPFVVPRMYSLLNIPSKCCLKDTSGRVFLPSSLTLSSVSLKDFGLYVLDNGRCLYLLSSPNLDPAIKRQLFGDLPQGGRMTTVLPGPLEGLNGRIQTLLDTLRSKSPVYQVMHAVQSSAGQQQHHLSASLDEAKFFSFMIEDGHARMVNENGHKEDTKLNQKQPEHMSYIDFLCWVHKCISSKFYSS
jgi:protein transport protein SEC24